MSAGRAKKNEQEAQRKKYAEHGMEKHYTFHEMSEVIKAPDSDIKAQVCELLSACRINYEAHLDGNSLCIDITWGDWKHGHAFVDHMMDTVFGLKCTAVEVTEDNGSDTYSASHYYRIDKET